MSNPENHYVLLCETETPEVNNPFFYDTGITDASFYQQNEIKAKDIHSYFL